MPKAKSWTDAQLADAVRVSKSYRAVLIALHLVPAGGNYAQIGRRVRELGLDLEQLLVAGSDVQSYKLKLRLFKVGLKQPACELCGWSKESPDGRIPVELDHVNGDHSDNRLENLRILCPNCHSLQPTHRGRNKKVALRARVS